MVDELVREALHRIGLSTRLPDAADGPADLVLDVDGAAVRLEVKQRALVDGNAARRLIDEVHGTSPTLLVVGDRVTHEARAALLAAQAGYLDLRGRLGLRAPGIVVDVDVPLEVRHDDRADGLAGVVGLQVAAHLLMSPAVPGSVRVIAREIERSASTVSQVLGAFRRDGLTDDSNRVVGTGLFWRLAERWTQSGSVVVAPDPSDLVTARAVRLGTEDPGTTGWALTDTAAAAAYGAPVAFRQGQQLDFLVPDRGTLQRAVRLLGGLVSPDRPAARIRVTPVPVATSRRVDLPAAAWPLAHPVFVALDLAQDVGRGREILEHWHPGDTWSRVW